MTIDRLAAESEVRRTVAAYCQAVDDGRWADLRACFTDDAEVFLGDRLVAVGPAAIGDWMAASQPPERRGMHVTVNALIDVHVGCTSAAASTDFLFLTSGHEVSASGRYRDELVPVGERWLLRRREIRLR